MLDFVKEVRRARGYRQDFILDPESWRRFALANPIGWKRIKFTGANKKRVPQERGVYAFVVSHDNVSFPAHGYVMYVGITGDASPRNLRKRFGDYLSDSALRKRPAIRSMIEMWKDDLYFHYAGVADASVRLGAIETALNDALLPPYSSNDFSGEVRGIARAAFS